MLIADAKGRLIFFTIDSTFIRLPAKVQINIMRHLHKLLEDLNQPGP